MKHFFFLITQLFWFTSDDGLGYFERKRMAEEYRKAMMEPIPSEVLRKWQEQRKQREQPAELKGNTDDI